MFKVYVIPVGFIGYGPQYAVYDPQNGYIYVTDGHAVVSVISGTQNIANITRPYISSLTYDPSDGYVYIEAFYLFVMFGTQIISSPIFIQTKYYTRRL